MRTVVWTIATLALLGLLAGGAVVSFGLYNIAARAGHWPITAWVLHTTYRRAVDLRAPAPGTAPPLTEEMARLGVRHFDGACRMCHAAPGQARTWTIRSMEPEPPPIAEAVGDWSPEELHWIIYNGVKMSGMPHWPSVREDDVWAVVAFLTRVQEMDAETYADWAADPPVPPGAPTGLAYCAGCHGLDGRSGNARIPRLDLQSEAYLAQALQSFREGRRESGIMAQAASAVPAESLPALAAWFASVPPAPEAAQVDEDLAARGEELAWAATQDPEVPACSGCHGPEESEVRRGPGPALAGQHESYLAEQLRLWRDGLRGGGPAAELMAKAAQHLDETDIAALAAYYAGLEPEAERR
ncbi:c-type cytochrome [Rubellimicrobium roseum]|uniref:C-type cytochrome n=1 Tax=Rubellimicrobium roseum TaxID=687525 RepID=A0A5C4NK55_9RHOB|nr:c-type cytochrome [Rubellimicrobium roseum]TNC74983.1 c-type cytochrome [Rubellimicrobium roseum]